MDIESACRQPRLADRTQLAERALGSGFRHWRKQAAAVSLALAALTGIGLGLAAPAASAQGTTPYAWKNVQIQGGGLVSGVVYHPARKNLVYARTDVGGIYRWVPATQTWLALNDDLGVTTRSSPAC
jgi:anti-sigma-K factor RskA